MKFTSKKTGKSFIISGKAAADFVFAKNARGEYINLLEDYYIDQQDDVSQVKFFLGCVGMTMLAVGSILLHLQWNF
jgi:hypothetical protein